MKFRWRRDVRTEPWALLPRIRKNRQRRQRKSGNVGGEPRECGGLEKTDNYVKCS